MQIEADSHRTLLHCAHDPALSFGSLSEAVAQLVWVCNSQTAVTYVNSRWIEFTGLSFAQSLGHGWRQVIHPDDLERCSDKWRWAREKTEPFENESRVLCHRTGEYRWHLTRVVPIGDETGALAYWVGTCTDIHDHKRREQSQIENRLLVDAALEAAQTSIWRLDIASDTIGWQNFSFIVPGVSPGYLRRPREEWLRRIHPEDLPWVEESMQRAISERATFRAEYRIVWDDQSVHWVFSRGRADYDEAGRVVQVTGSITDITERKEAEAALHKALEKVNHINRELNQFASVASHDLREPLRMVSTYLRALGERHAQQLDPTATQLIDHALEGTLRMNALVEDLLTYSRVGRERIAFVQVDTSKVVTSVLSNLRIAVEEAQATIHVGTLPLVIGDGMLLGQVFQNLVSNALKFRREPGARIELSCHCDARFWIFEIKDNGIGIAAEHFQKIFEPFQRLHPHQDYNGSGIGLATCKRVVELHGGKIWVDSILGGGSTFYFTLPQRESVTASEAIPS